MESAIYAKITNLETLEVINALYREVSFFNAFSNHECSPMSAWILLRSDWWDKAFDPGNPPSLIQGCPHGIRRLFVHILGLLC